MKRSDRDSVMKRASGAVKRTDNWSRAKREYANKVTHSGSLSYDEPKLSRQHQSQTTSSSSGQKK
jgi:hypothetical protein